MVRKITQILISATLLLLLAGWSIAPIPSTEKTENAQGEPATFSPAFKTKLPVDFTMDD